MAGQQKPTNFWSRRRAAVEAEARAEAEARLAARTLAEDQALTAAQAERTDAEILTDLGLPDPEGMAMGDDFAAFLQKSVPEHLRRRALRKLWLSNPVLANLDGLLDHNDDFTGAATVMPDMKTTYQVGRGLSAHVEALAQAAEDERAAEDEQAAEDGQAAEMSATDPMPGSAETKPDAAARESAGDREAISTAAEDAGNAARTEPTNDPEPVRPRHLRFEFTS